MWSKSRIIQHRWLYEKNWSFGADGNSKADFHLSLQVKLYSMYSSAHGQLILSADVGGDYNSPLISKLLLPTK